MFLDIKVMNYKMFFYILFLIIMLFMQQKNQQNVKNFNNGMMRLYLVFLIKYH